MNPTNPLSFRPERLLCETPGCYKAVKEAWEVTGRLCPDCAIQHDLFDRQARWERIDILNRLSSLQSAFAALA